MTPHEMGEAIRAARAFVWVLLVVWYVVVFGLFGVVTIPFRLLRRGQRKGLAAQKEMLAEQRAQIEEMRRLSGGSS